ncbi:HipA domain-containing protein [Oryzomonas rubra]|uniref:HipA-like C-terminal domain-containing protein n=1 Tax=Oryzomonas rubra TaxID=2509454 RepID=A0A5A9XIY7_9BACT|nr:HipA domain-containing protein [Oryzomonas rubra]KAA0891651.1 hypothetical protein ET418_09390 [Oryzomonas rubra]
MKIQNPDQLVYLNDYVDDEYSYEGLYPKGAREKKSLTAPPNVPYDFLINRHRYLFKKSFRRYPHQFWIEIAAYRIGCLMGVSVPPAFVAYDSYDAEFGALIEWFYDYPNSDKQAYHDGGVYMMQLIDDYDMKAGAQHNFVTISTLMRALHKIKVMSENWAESWAKIFTFDTIIGNTDRHHDNWGIIWNSNNSISGEISAVIAPAFDNGTSLGHEIIDSNLAKFENLDMLNSYINRGKHHARWQKDDIDRITHIEFMKRYANKFPDTRQTILNCLSFDSTRLIEVIYQLTHFDVLVPLTEPRAKFMVNLVETRRRNLLRELGA